MIRMLLMRNCWLYLLVIVLLIKGADANDCFIKRGKYLLGISYNGFFQNQNDNKVYEDYLKRHGSAPREFQKNI